jgi:hypothetical protein
VVSDAPLHHSPLGLPTLFYGVLLLPTLSHFSPHHRLLLAVVKRKKHVRSKKVAHRPMREDEENHHDRLCLYGAEKSIPRVLLLDQQTLIWGGAACWDCTLTRLPATKNVPLFLFPSTHAMLLLSLTPFKEPAHGMGYPSARRDRPELRNQLVRQRRALTFQTRSRSARFVFTLGCEGKRARGISSLSAALHYQHRLSCLHAR